jgi:hypothetical protein
MHAARGALPMIWRILLVVLKSALIVAAFEFFRPVADAIGLQLTFVSTVAGAISQAARIPNWEAEILFLLAVAFAVTQITRIFWDLITG